MGEKKIKLSRFVLLSRYFGRGCTSERLPLAVLERLQRSSTQGRKVSVGEQWFETNGASRVPVQPSLGASAVQLVSARSHVSNAIFESRFAQSAQGVLRGPSRRTLGGLLLQNAQDSVVDGVPGEPLEASCRRVGTECLDGLRNALPIQQTRINLGADEREECNHLRGVSSLFHYRLDNQLQNHGRYLSRFDGASVAFSGQFRRTTNR